MSTAAEKLAQIRLKTERAKKHVKELGLEISGFYGSNPYKVGTKKNTQSGKLTYYVLSVQDTPSALAQIIGDILQNLRSALDHLAYQLVSSYTGGNPPSPDEIYFPIFWSPPKDETVIQGKIKGAPIEVARAIHALKPYKGGNDDLWMLHRLNNIDKHRFILTASSQAAGVSLTGLGPAMPGLPGDTPEQTAEMQAMMDKMLAGLFLMPADKGFPLKAGFELLDTDGDPNPKQQFRFQVAFNEPGIVEGKPIVETINQLVTTVDNIIGILSGHLRDTP